MPAIENEKEWLSYAEEADLLNMILFGCTAKQWRDANPDLCKGNSNIRDFATIHELVVLSNLETHNAEMIKRLVSKEERFCQLKEIACYQLNILNQADILTSAKKQVE